MSYGPGLETVAEGRGYQSYLAYQTDLLIAPAIAIVSVFALTDPMLPMPSASPDLYVQSLVLRLRDQKLLTHRPVGVFLRDGGMTLHVVVGVETGEPARLADILAGVRRALRYDVVGIVGAWKLQRVPLRLFVPG